MREHLIVWPVIGLLCTALGTAALAQDRTTPEAALEPSLTTDTSSFTIQAQQRRQDLEQRKAQRASIRQATEQWHVLLGQVLPLDANTRNQLLELLTDLQMESDEVYANEQRDVPTRPSYPSLAALRAAVERERFAANNRLQRGASEVTSYRQRIRDLLGEARFQQYVDYELTVTQRRQVVEFEKQLPAGDKLDASQRERLILLLDGQLQQLFEALHLDNAQTNGEYARRGYTSPADAGEPSQRELRTYERRLQLAETGSKQLLAQLRNILTPRQLALYEANEAKIVAAELQLVKRMRKRAGVDIENPSPATVVPPRTPLAGRVRLDVSIKINDSAITQRSLLADNGGEVTFEIAPLTIEAVPTLFDDGWRELTVKFYESDGKGGHRRVIPSPRAAGIMAGADTVQKLDAQGPWASRGYAIIGNFTQSAANP